MYKSKLKKHPIPVCSFHSIFVSMTFFIRPLLLLCLTLMFSAPSVGTVQHEEPPVQLTFLPEFTGAQLQLDTVQYYNAAGQPMWVTKFRFYISAVSLWLHGEPQFTDPDYYLPDASDAKSLTITLKKSEGIAFDEIRFIVGVDSAHNVSGAQSGALDPVNGMFWAWNTGYIFLKLEGRSSACPNPGGVFEYHIGGFREPANNIREIRLKCNNAGRMVRIRTDVSEILKSPATIDFKALPSVTGPAGSGIIADNYADMFLIESVK